MTVAFPPWLRATFYWIIFAAGLFLGGAAIVCAVYGTGTPNWLEAANQVLVYLSAALGITAASHTVLTRTTPPVDDHEVNRVDRNRTDPTPERELKEEP